MHIYSALQIGDYHINHCEDYLFIGSIGSDKVLCAVMDGCTNGVDSHFISTLVGKLLRKITLQKNYEELYHSSSALTDNDAYLKSILRELFKELVTAKNQLMLDKKELLSTLIILLADKKANNGIILAVGDGVVAINGNITEFDQENTPDYLGFHLGEDFESWFTNQKQKIYFDEIRDISIATDGIGMFAQIKKAERTDPIDPLAFLLVDELHKEHENMLGMKLKTLEHSYGLKPGDDLAIIRLIN
jgi:hypothetical protein